MGTARSAAQTGAQRHQHPDGDAPPAGHHPGDAARGADPRGPRGAGWPQGAGAGGGRAGRVVRRSGGSAGARRVLPRAVGQASWPVLDRPGGLSHFLLKSLPTTMSNPTKKGLFVGDDGKNLMFTFILVSSLFLLWGFCNGMIDVMDKHFQEELGLNKSQSAWVQFAHYLGYFLMSMPAGWLAGKLGYKGGIITGLLIVAAGGFWFIPATHINAMVHEGTVSPTTAFVAFLAGVCLIATGLTFLETIANPYTTVLGPKTYAATRINLAQSCNGVGWIFGPVVGGMFFYSTNAAGKSTGSETLYIPYVVVAAAVIVIAVIFYFANVPDIKSQDDYHLDESDAGNTAETLAAPVAEREFSRGLVYLLLWLNSAVLIFSCGMILWVILSTVGVKQGTAN